MRVVHSSRGVWQRAAAHGALCCLLLLDRGVPPSSQAAAVTRQAGPALVSALPAAPAPAPAPTKPTKSPFRPEQIDLEVWYQLKVHYLDGSFGSLGAEGFQALRQLLASYGPPYCLRTIVHCLPLSSYYLPSTSPRLLSSYTRRTASACATARR